MKEGPCTSRGTGTVSSGGEKLTEEGDRREMNLHEVFSLRVTKLKGSVKHSGTDGLY